MASSTTQLLRSPINQIRPHYPFPLSKLATVKIPALHGSHSKLRLGFTVEISTPRAFPANEGIATDLEDGVSLGTMKLPADIDIARFETLLFQWANSLCQGANLPLPVPLKVDKVQGGVRLGFIKVEDGKTQVFVYIDCLVYPAVGGTGPVFRATRNGPVKEKIPPGEERIMRSLLQALTKSVEIARV